MIHLNNNKLMISKVFMTKNSMQNYKIMSKVSHQYRQLNKKLRYLNKHKR